MSQIFESNTENEPISRYAIPVRYGLMLGFISMFMTTISFLYLLKLHFMAFTVGTFLMFLVPIIFYAIVATRQRKAIGGYISMKDAFQVIFIVILISSVISSIYGLIYAIYIDPDSMIRMKESMLSFFDSIQSMPQEQIDEQAKKMDERISNSNSFSSISYGFASSIILQSIFGFIVALIVKKERPINPQ